MKRLMWFAGLLAIAGIMTVCDSVPCFAQDNAVSPPAYSWSKVTATGQLGHYINLMNAQTGAPARVTISFDVTGTAPSACTFRIEGSADGVAWTGLDVAAPGADTTPCTSSNQVYVNDKVVQKLRVYIVSYTPGDGTTSVVFSFTGGRI